MRISIFGTGYVGSVTGICLADLGHDVIFTDIDTRKLDLINESQIPVFEPGLQPLLDRNHHRISTTPNPSFAVEESDISFICVGTPSEADGSIDLSYIDEAGRNIGRGIAQKSGHHGVVVKSTVIPGTIENVIVPILIRESGKKEGSNFNIFSNPEFLREGNAVNDFFQPDRIVIGTSDPRLASILDTLYTSIKCPRIITTIKTAEMIKYVNNAFLATKVSFSNEIGNICKKIGVDSYEVFRGVGMDSRINPAFFRSGIGFGGSCFPKDVRALIAFSKKMGIEPRILNAVIETNERQPDRMVTLLANHLDIRGKTIGILGLAFKPDTDDVRESRAIPIIKKLLLEGANVIAYDPMAMNNFKQFFPDILYADSARDVIRADAVIITTEWPEFEEVDFSGKIVLDGRNMRKIKRNAKIYEGVCW